MIKPEKLTFEQAASIPSPGRQHARSARQMKSSAGHKVLINGAAGGVGTFALQLAKHCGAHATGVRSTRNVGLVKSLSADAVVEYSKENFTESAER